MNNTILPNELTIKGKNLILPTEYKVNTQNKGFFILDMHQQCDYPDLNTFPALYVECENDIQIYELFKYNVVIGQLEDLC